MAIAEYVAGTQAIGISDFHSLVTDTAASPDVETDDGVYQAFLDLSDMVTGDHIIFIIYETVDATQRSMGWFHFHGVQPVPIWVSPTLVLTGGWDMVISGAVGTVTVDWSIRAVT